MSERKASAEAPAAPFALAFAELRAIVGPEKENDLTRWKDRWIDEAGAPSTLSLGALCVAGIEEHIRRQQAATFGELLAARPGVLARTKRPLEFGSVVFGAFLCAVRAEPKVPPGEALLVKDGNVAVRESLVERVLSTELKMEADFMADLPKEDRVLLRQRLAESRGEPQLSCDDSPDLTDAEVKRTVERVRKLFTPMQEA